MGGAGILPRNDREFGKTAIHIHAQNLGVLADMGLPEQALFAFAANDMALRSDKITHLSVGNVVGNFSNRAAELVSNNTRRLDPRS